MGIRLFQEKGSLSISTKDLFYVNFYKTFFVRIKNSKTFVFFLGTSSEYLTIYGQGSVFKDPL